MNESLPFNLTMMPQYANTPTEYTYTVHLFGFTDILFISAIFIFMSYWYIKVSKDKEKYQHWTNPNGHEVNLYRIIRICFWAYVGVVIVLGGLQILLAR